MDPITGQKVFDRFISFDSAVGKNIKIDFAGVKNWVAIVNHVHFCLPEGTYEDQNAYLLITGSSIFTNSTVTQLQRKPNGALLPIMWPTSITTSRIKAYLKGRYEGPDELTFMILDRDLKEVPVARLIVHLHVFNDVGKVLNW